MAVKRGHCQIVLQLDVAWNNCFRVVYSNAVGGRLHALISFIVNHITATVVINGPEQTVIVATDSAFQRFYEQCQFLIATNL